ncbi:MAG TPA: hypothetical protein VGN95_10365 [Pyrinomonadaceae bacterium]|nr:hypothetical protein [Pyrinomonadaceae bacterium]
MNIRHPEPRGKGVPEIAPLVIAHVGETYSHMFPALMVLEVVFMLNAWVVFFTTLIMTQILKYNVLVALAVASCLGLLLTWFGNL